MIYGPDEHNLDGLEDAVREAVTTLRPHKRDFDSIVVSGMSGVIVGLPTALRLHKPLVVVRKAEDGSHHGGGNFINAEKLGYRALFLDDFIHRGTTLDYVRDKVKGQGAKIAGKYLYQGDWTEDLGRVPTLDWSPTATEDNLGR